MNLQLTSIILFVNDVDALKHFYCKYFQLQVVEEMAAEWVLLDAGGCQLGLHKIGKAYSDSAGAEFKTNSNAKIVFETGADIQMLQQQLINDHIIAGEIKTFPGYGYWIFDGGDPEGNVFQVKQKKS